MNSLSYTTINSSGVTRIKPKGLASAMRSLNNATVESLLECKSGTREIVDFVKLQRRRHRIVDLGEWGQKEKNILHRICDDYPILRHDPYVPC
jgi:hypothetical protein